MSKQRIDWIDIAKGIGIIAMVIGHIDFGTELRYFIHAWNMPVFFILSGYLHRDDKYSFSQRIIKRAKALLIPYFSFGLIHFVIWLVKYRPDTEAVQHTVRGLLWINTNNSLPIANALWFLPCMFFASVIFDGIHRISGKGIIKEAVCVVIAAAAGMAIPTFTGTELPWALSQAFVAVGFIYIGALLKRSNIMQRIGSLKLFPFWTIITVSGAISGCMIMLHQEVNMRTSSYGCFPIFIINAAVFSTLISAVAERMSNTKIRIIGILTKEIKFIGNNSIVYLCLNQITIFAVGMLLVSSEHIAVDFVYLLICMTLLHIFAAIITRSPFNVLIGRMAGKEQNGGRTLNIYVRIKGKLRNIAKRFDTLIMRFSCSLNGVKVGKRVTCCGRLYIRNTGHCKIGSNVRLNSAIWANPIGGGTRTCFQTFQNGSIEIGDGTGISNTAITSMLSVKIGKNCLIGSGCKIYDTDFHPVQDSEITVSKPIVIGDRVFLGEGVTVLKGVTIGDDAVVGAESVVTHDIPAGEIWGGNPARLIRKSNK